MEGCRATKAGQATTYHTTGISKPVVDPDRSGDDSNDPWIDFGADAKFGDVCLRKPDCRYEEVVASDGNRLIHIKAWADDTDSAASIRHNEVDQVNWVNMTTNKRTCISVDRKSHTGKYNVDPETNLPLNPWGRTGTKGPGVLGRLGPNHAADPIVSRKWAAVKGKGFSFVAIRRKDTGELAIPGGMVDPGESITATLKREFQEEASAGQAVISPKLTQCFDKAVELYRGMVNDPRNTNNAWMETVVKLVDITDLDPSELHLQHGSDARNVYWADVIFKDGEIVVLVDGNAEKLYASHADFILQAYKQYFPND